MITCFYFLIAVGSAVMRIYSFNILNSTEKSKPKSLWLSTEKL
jgi:hypothetical protein